MKGCMEACSPEEKLVRLLAKKQMTITTAESCTGGLIAGTIVNVAGASDVLNEGYVTYSNEAWKLWLRKRCTLRARLTVRLHSPGSPGDCRLQ